MTPAVNPALHCCAAKGCARQIGLRYLMCPRHWKMVPSPLQMLIWKHYKRGQEFDHAKITREYVEAMREAIAAVGQAEGMLR